VTRVAWLTQSESRAGLNDRTVTATCENKLMLSFHVKEHGTGSCTPGTKAHVLGRTAPGNGVLIIQDGSAWVARQDGTRAVVNAKSVVFYEAGDWVEYGTSDWFKAEEDWAASEPEGAAEARLAAAFGPQAS
jgi:hypothetical protein